MMRKRGGCKYTDLTNNIMAKVLSDDLASLYSFCGKQNKSAFKGCILSACIISKYTVFMNFTPSRNSLVYLMIKLFPGAVSQSFKEVTEKDIELKIAAWLANAPTRMMRKS